MIRKKKTEEAFQDREEAFVRAQERYRTVNHLSLYSQHQETKQQKKETLENVWR